MKTPISYYGGKQNLVKTILPIIPKHQIYVEPFFGGGALFFAKPVSQREAINDTSKLVVNFYSVCRDFELFEKLKHKIRYTLHCRKTYYEAKEKLNSECKIERAWAFWVQTNMSFMKKIGAGWSFGRLGQNNALTTQNKREAFDERVYERLKDVYIDNLDALKVIKHWDSKDTFFYIDPPYFNANMGHYKGYTEQDFGNLLNALSKIKGSFLLSSYPSNILNDFGFKSISKIQNLQNGILGAKKTEVLSCNYSIEPQQTIFI